MFEIKRVDITKCPCINYQQVLDVYGEEFINLINKISLKEGVLFVPEKERPVEVGDEIVYNDVEFLVLSTNGIGVLLLSPECGLLYWDYR